MEAAKFQRPSLTAQISYKPASIPRLIAIIILLLVWITVAANGCSAQYRRELNYLDYYLGIKPANEEGEIGVQGENDDARDPGALRLRL